MGLSNVRIGQRAAAAEREPRDERERERETLFRFQGFRIGILEVVGWMLAATPRVSRAYILTRRSRRFTRDASQKARVRAASDESIELKFRCAF